MKCTVTLEITSLDVTQFVYIINYHTLLDRIIDVKMKKQDDRAY